MIPFSTTLLEKISMDSLEAIEIAVDELTHPLKRLDREANRPPALLYYHLRECIGREPHMPLGALTIPHGSEVGQAPQRQAEDDETEERMYA